MPLLKKHQQRPSLLSVLFVQPCHSLADPPLAVWMDGEGQYTDPGCPLTVHAGNNRGPCVPQVASHAANEPCHWPQSANAITQHKRRHFEPGLWRKTSNWMWQITGLLRCPSYTEARRRSWYGLIWWEESGQLWICREKQRWQKGWMFHQGKAEREMAAVRITLSARKGSTSNHLIKCNNIAFRLGNREVMLRRHDFRDGAALSVHPTSDVKK